MYGVGQSIGRASYRRLPGPLLRRFKSYEATYADKIRQKALQTGLSAEELRKQSLERLKEEQRVQAASLPVLRKPPISTGASDKPETRSEPRKDGPPVKPLSDILRLSRIATATKEQVSALWTAYHASRSEGTGRGYLCAAIPVDIYNKMAGIGKKHPCFVVPLPRPDLEEPTKINHEFFFMEWAFHHAPPTPSANDDPFAAASSKDVPTPNPQLSTVLFTPLQEYKMRNSFATPYLILTHYTDLAESHGIILLRGEITPAVAGTSADGRFMLSQEDAQMLAMGIQKFYLWGEKDGEPEGERLLKAFHQKPEEFSWEELLKLYNKII